jgi:hypothetical protein
MCQPGVSQRGRRSHDGPLAVALALVCIGPYAAYAVSKGLQECFMNWR